MLVQLGSRSIREDVVDLLAECHVRIRKFLEIARTLASSGEPDPEQRREAARQVHRYFTEAFPLHMADEDDTITPHLAGQSPAIDSVLQTMHTDHADHAPAIARLVAACAAVMREPAPDAERDAELLAAVHAATAAIEPHLVLEERELFPALRALPATASDAIRTAMRARRDAALSQR